MRRFIVSMYYIYDIFYLIIIVYFSIISYCLILAGWLDYTPVYSFYVLYLWYILFDYYRLFQYNKLLSDLGGLTGLCAGLSVLTMLEFLELVLDLVVFSCMKLRKVVPDKIPDPIYLEYPHGTSLEEHRIWIWSNYMFVYCKRVFMFDCLCVCVCFGREGGGGDTP